MVEGRCPARLCCSAAGGARTWRAVAQASARRAAWPSARGWARPWRAAPRRARRSRWARRRRPLRPTRAAPRCLRAAARRCRCGRRRAWAWRARRATRPASARSCARRACRRRCMRPRGRQFPRSLVRALGAARPGSTQWQCIHVCSCKSGLHRTPFDAEVWRTAALRRHQQAVQLTPDGRAPLAVAAGSSLTLLARRYTPAVCACNIRRCSAAWSSPACRRRAGGGVAAALDYQLAAGQGGGARAPARAAAPMPGGAADGVHRRPASACLGRCAMIVRPAAGPRPAARPRPSAAHACQP